MWRMLTGRSEDLKVELADHSAEGDTGTAHWIATYTFSHRAPVVNDIQARFRFRDGKIVDHEDSFSLGAGLARRWGRSVWRSGGAPCGRWSAAGRAAIWTSSATRADAEQRPAARSCVGLPLRHQLPDAEEGQEEAAARRSRSSGSSAEKPSSLLPR